MRYVPSGCLRPGMTLGREVYSEAGAVLLAKDVKLTQGYIDNIQKLLINGVYIVDNISEDIRIEHVISNELRVAALKTLKKIYNNPKGMLASLDSVENIAKKMISEILQNKSIMINMIDVKTFDNFMYSHCVSVAILSAVIGIGLNLSEDKLEKLVSSALLHDIGKVFIPKEILNKEKDLTKEEEELIKGHPEAGYKYIKTFHTNIAITSYIGILQHHERYDGKGYPDRKKGEKISLFGRIISLCDAYDNLISEKPNKKACIPSEAIEYIMANNGTIFDPKLVKMFLRKVAPYPLGTIVKLSNGKNAIVIENNDVCSTRPKVRLIEEGTICELISDWKCRNVTIIDVVQL